MDQNPCEKICIPTELHWNARPIDEDFTDENLFRRTRISIDSSKIDDNKISAAIFPIKDDSCNREKYSQADDVLFNIMANDCDDHFLNYGIVKINSNYILSESFSPEGSPDNYTFKILHCPTNCMYPHSEISVFKNNEKISDHKPKSVKAFIRDIIISNCIIVKDFQSI
ncbi:hypothetical protein B0A69_03990 [Chryseobacterium shigense]|uniref:Uncharacterized protein n=1 Tax=Chryseobacterium shigense TaxID=297244 RepID=A0A1N7IRV2_9FLAO|nr:hypothetical protein [Chryseobacterium shigense]PQA95552.1 hypothetical protein B0A69_03990 [Chryseobacterium shigense]SIS39808.1 hypothetical protein SAMN05421639_104473 [Chryseobacterium shigense]